jgi:hypothetical protein
MLNDSVQSQENGTHLLLLCRGVCYLETVCEWPHSTCVPDSSASGLHARQAGRMGTAYTCQTTNAARPSLQACLLELAGQ